MKEMIKKVDFFGGNVSLSYKGNNGVRTIFGGIVTILNGILLILLIIMFGVNFYERINPLFFVQEVFEKEKEQFKITNKNFPFSFRFTNVYDKRMDIEEKSFYFDIFREKFERIDGELKKIYTEPVNYKVCNREEFQNDHLYDSYGLSNHFCLDYSEFPHYELGGDYNGNHLNLIYFNYVKCIEGSNNRHNVPCATEEETKILMDDFLFASFYLPSIIVDPGNYTNPYETTLENLAAIIDNNIVKNNWYEFGVTQLISDIGWILENKIKYSEISYRSYSWDFNLLSSVYDPYYKTVLGSATIIMNKNITRYTRIYSKIQNLAAEVGGILKVFSFLMSIIIQFYNSSYFDLKLYDTMKKYIINEIDRKVVKDEIVIENNSKINNANSSIAHLNLNKSNMQQNNVIVTHSNFEEMKSKIISIESNLLLINRLNHELKNKYSIDKNRLPTLFNFLLFKISCCFRFKEKDYTNLLRLKLNEYLDIETILINSIIKRLNNVMFDEEEQSFYLKS